MHSINHHGAAQGLGIIQERMDSTVHTNEQHQSAQPQIRQLTEDEIAQGCKLDPCIGMRVSRYWPEVSSHLLDSGLTLPCHYPLYLLHSDNTSHKLPSHC